MNILNKIPLTLKLTLLLILMICGLLTVGYISLSSLGEIKRGLDTVYFGSMLPTKQLKTITDMYTIEIAETIEKTLSESFTIDQAIEEITKAREKIDKNRTQYFNSYHKPEEMKLLELADTEMEKTDILIDKVLSHYSKNDLKEIADVYHNELYNAVSSTRKAVYTVIDHEYKAAEAEKDNAWITYRKTKKSMLTAFIIIAVMVIIITTPVLTNIRSNQKELLTKTIKLKELNENLEDEKDRLADFTEYLSSINSVDTGYLAENALSQLLIATDSQIGVFYHYQNGQLRLLSSKSVDDTVFESESFSLSNEGLPKKAIESNKWLTIKDLEESTIPQIDTGLFKASIKRIHAIPVVFKNIKLGVLLLASVSDREKETPYIRGYINSLANSLSNASSYATIERQSSHLSQANMELERANKMKNEFLANVSHELRTPLNSIIGFSAILMKNKKNHLDEKELSHIEKVNRNGIYLLKIINDILDLSKVEAGRTDIEITSFKISTLMTEILSMLKTQTLDKNVSLELINLLEKDIDMESDEQKLRQVIINIVGNAIKFVDPGKGKVEVMLSQRETNIVIAVKDNGIGIEQEKQETIFDAFSQADAGSAKRYGGTGLGLTISKNLIHLLGGAIDLESTPGEGSLFIVTLPFKDKNNRAAVNSDFGKTQPLAMAHPRELTILHIDDDEDSLNLIREYVRDHGHKVIHTKTGESGIAKAKQHKPDAIILDVILPDINGWEVLKILKSDTDTSNISVIIVSIVADERKDDASGAMAYLSKPLSKEEFLNSISNISIPLT